MDKFSVFAAPPLFTLIKFVSLSRFCVLPLNVIENYYSRCIFILVAEKHVVYTYTRTLQFARHEFSATRIT